MKLWQKLFCVLSRFIWNCAWRIAEVHDFEHKSTMKLAVPCTIIQSDIWVIDLGETSFSSISLLSRYVIYYAHSTWLHQSHFGCRRSLAFQAQGVHYLRCSYYNKSIVSCFLLIQRRFWVVFCFGSRHLCRFDAIFHRLSVTCVPDSPVVMVTTAVIIVVVVISIIFVVLSISVAIIFTSLLLEYSLSSSLPASWLQ